MKKLPNIYKNNNIVLNTNNKKYCSFKNTNNLEKDNNIKDTINNLFKGLGHSYNIPVVITTTSKEYDTFLISRTRDNVITIENELIPIDSIIKLIIKN